MAAFSWGSAGRPLRAGLTIGSSIRSPGRFFAAIPGAGFALIALSTLTALPDPAAIVILVAIIVCGTASAVGILRARLTLTPPGVVYVRGLSSRRTVPWADIAEFVPMTGRQSVYVGVVLENGNRLRCRRISTSPTRKRGPARMAGWIRDLNAVLQAERP